MLKRVNYLWLFLILLLVSLVVILPSQVTLAAPFTDQSKALTINLPKLDFYFWGRRVNLQPTYQLSLDYASGQLFIFQLDNGAEVSLDQRQQLEQVARDRLQLFFQEPVLSRVASDANDSYLLLELMPSKEDWLLANLLLAQGEFEILIQKADVAEDELIFADNWLQNFESIGLSSHQIKHAKEQLHPQTSQPVVQITLDNQGRQILSRATRANVSKLYLITFDGSPVAMPPINEPIFDGKVMISGGASLLQAKLLASVLQGGALPAQLLEVEEHSFQASEPRLNFAVPMTAGLIGLTLVIVLLGLFFKKRGWLVGVTGAISVMIQLAVIRLVGMIVSPGLMLALGLVIFWWLATVTALVAEAVSSQEKLDKVILTRRKKLYVLAGTLFFCAVIVMILAGFSFWSHQLVLALFARSLFILTVSQGIIGYLLILSYLQQTSSQKP